MDGNTDRFAGYLEYVAKLIANRISKSYVPDNAFSKKRRFVCTSSGSIKELVRDEHVGWRVLLLQRTDGRDRKDVFDPEQLYRINVRPKGKFGGQKPVSAAVTPDPKPEYRLLISETALPASSTTVRYTVS